MTQRWIMIVGMGLLFSTFCLAQNDRKTLENQRNKIIEEIEATSELLSTTANKQATTLEDYKVLDKQIGKRQNLIDNLKASIDANNRSIVKNKASLDSLKASSAALRDQYRHLLKMVHINEHTGISWTKYLSAASFNEAFRRWVYARQFDRYVKSSQAQMQELSLAIDQRNLSLANAVADRARSLTSEKEQQRKLDREKEQKDKILKKLKKQEKALKAKLAKQKKQREQLNAAIEAAILAALKAPKKASPSGSAGATFASSKGRLPWPSDGGVVTSRFGKQPHPTLKNVQVNNNGIDISSPRPLAVKAVYAGTVVAVSKIPGYDHMVITQHGDYYTVYSRVTEVLVSKDASVGVGQQIGVAGREEGGRYTLHFELWKDKDKLNPSTWLAK